MLVLTPIGIAATRSMPDGYSIIGRVAGLQGAARLEKHAQPSEIADPSNRPSKKNARQPFRKLIDNTSG